MWSLNDLFNDSAKKRKKFIIVRNHEYKKNYTINSVLSSLKSHPCWVTLYIYIIYDE